jgi:hypothetical protein
MKMEQCSIVVNTPLESTEGAEPRSNGRISKAYRGRNVDRRRSSFEGKREFLELLASELPPVVARKDVGRLLGGMVTAKTLANADSKGTGPEIVYTVGRNVVYRRESLLEWVERKFTIQKQIKLKSL